MAKRSIVEALGESRLVLPSLINEALGANDRLKYRLSLLQLGRRHADRPEAALPSLLAERQQAGVDDPSLDALPATCEAVGSAADPRYRAAGLDRLLSAVANDLGCMLAPALVADTGSALASRAALSARLEELRPLLRAPDDTITGPVIDQLTHSDRTRSDSAHLLVMDLHRLLNELQQSVARESIRGAAVYGLQPDDRVLVDAFMRGIERTAALKFDHPGLGTTATRSADRLVIQNDIGVTDAHVLVLHVTPSAVSVTYTDVHPQRLAFFQRLLAAHPVEWSDGRTLSDPTFEDGHYRLVVGTHAADSLAAAAAFLEYLGSRLVFLIDWNRARKRLRLLVGKREAIELLEWAAAHDIGHMAFLRLGGESLVFDALEFAARGQLRAGQDLEDLLGRERAVKFLQFVLTTAKTELLGGNPARLAVDEIRAELLRHVHGAGSTLLELAAEHAALIVEIASAVRDVLLPPHGRPKAADARIAACGSRWESDADRVLERARATVAPNDEGAFLKQLIATADDVADALEDAVFLATQVGVAGISGHLAATLSDLAGRLLCGTQEFVKALATLPFVTPGARRDDLRDFLEAVHRIAAVEHDTDALRRRLISAVAAEPIDPRQLYVATATAAKIEQAGDALLHTALMLRDRTLERLTPH